MRTLLYAVSMTNKCFTSSAFYAQGMGVSAPLTAKMRKITPSGDEYLNRFMKMHLDHMKGRWGLVSLQQQIANATNCKRESGKVISVFEIFGVRVKLTTDLDDKAPRSTTFRLEDE